MSPLIRLFSVTAVGTFGWGRRRRRRKARGRRSRRRRSRVRLIAAGPLGYQGRRLAGRTWDSPAVCQPCRRWWSVPLHSQTASDHRNAPIAHSHFSTLWSVYAHWVVCPCAPIPSGRQNWTQATLAAGTFLMLVASSSCLSVPEPGIPACTSPSLQLDHEAPKAHLEKQQQERKLC